MVFPAHNAAQEISSHERRDDTQFVLIAHIGIEQALAPQPLDALPAVVLQCLEVASLVLLAKEQDVEIGTEKAAAHGIEVLPVIILHHLFQVFSNPDDIGALGRELVQDAVLALAVAV